MSDLIKKVSFIEDTEGDANVTSETQKAERESANNVSDILRRSDDPLTPKRVPSDPPPIRSLLSREELPKPSKALFWLGLGLAMLTAIALGIWTYSQFLSVGFDDLSPWQWAGLICAVIVPATAIVVLFATLNALQTLRNRSDRLVAITDRLSRADTAVAEEVEALSSVIRREIVAVDTRIETTRQTLDGFKQAIAEQGRDLEATTKTMTERSEKVGSALTLHRQAFESLSTTFEAQMERLSDQIAKQRAAFEDTTRQAEVDLTASKSALETAGSALAKTISETAENSQSAYATIDAARDRLSTMVEKVAETTTQLDEVYARQTQHLSDLENQAATEKNATEAALLAQAERLGAIDAQIEITEARLTELVDHARSVHETLLIQITALDETLESADTRSQRFTSDLTERVSDVVAEARRDMSLMENDLRTLQSRLRTTGDETAELDLPAGALNPSASRVTLRPLETDFPPLEPSRPRPRNKQDEPLDLVDLIEPEDDIVIVEPIPDIPVEPEPEVEDLRDVIRRPGEASPPKKRRSFGRANEATAKETPKDRAGWRWRDMLGGIDPLDSAEQSTEIDATKPESSTIVRPPAGVPLAPIPPAPTLSDGSDVVARLCEVQLAPSAVVDEGTIIEASRVRLSGGPKPMIEAVSNRLGEPIVHLRGVLSADLEFKLRAEQFVRSMEAQLSSVTDAEALRATFGSASGRAYLLCATALNR